MDSIRKSAIIVTTSRCGGGYLWTAIDSHPDMRANDLIFYDHALVRGRHGVPFLTPGRISVDYRHNFVLVGYAHLWTQTADIKFKDYLVVTASSNVTIRNMTFHGKLLVRWIAHELEVMEMLVDSQIGGLCTAIVPNLKDYIVPIAAGSFGNSPVDSN